VYPAFSFTLEIIFDTWSFSTSVNIVAKFAELSDCALVKREQLLPDEVRRARRIGGTPERAALKRYEARDA